jgi:MFS family permease
MREPTRSIDPVSVAEPAPVERARDLRSIVADGVFFSTMVGLGETFVPAFALAVGFGEVTAGLVATLPLLLGAVFQLVTPLAVRQLRSYRRWIVLCACLQGLSFAPLILGAILGSIGWEWLAISMISYWAFGMATGPAWNAWVTSLVPEPIRARFFASRTRTAQAALVAAMLLGGAVLHWGRSRGEELGIFAVLFAGAMLARFVSAGFLARQSEAPGLAASHRALPPRAVLASVRVARSGRVFIYLLGMQAVVNVAAPFFTPYMLSPLALSYGEFMTLTATAFVARVVVLPVLGRIAGERGTRIVLWWGAVGIVPLPVLWLVSDAFLYLVVVQIVAGSAWAALEFATLLSFFEGVEESSRASVLAAFNLGNAAAIGVGALVGSQLFLGAGGSAAGYAWLFAISAAGRLGMLLVLRGTPPARRVVPMWLRTLAVRPSAGAVERPILATIGSDVPEAPGRSAR